MLGRDRSGLDEATRQKLLRRGLHLEYATLVWNVGEATVVLIAAALAHSVALTGFGLDSLIEIFASVVVVWQIRGDDKPARERRALRLIGLAFFGIAAYVAAESAHSLMARAHPHTSVLGMASLGATAFEMALLGIWKGRVGGRLDHAVLRTEARVTLTDAYLAGSILLGLVLNAALHWWWADPVAALVIVFYGIKEGRESWRRTSG
ncbi:MAG TPA: cation transporter [Actinomycetota bacterium]|nr:cation transporter [Actinomycetota bacterium]